MVSRRATHRSRALTAPVIVPLTIRSSSIINPVEIYHPACGVTAAGGGRSECPKLGRSEGNARIGPVAYPPIVRNELQTRRRDSSSTASCSYDLTRVHLASALLRLIPATRHDLNSLGAVSVRLSPTRAFTHTHAYKGTTTLSLVLRAVGVRSRFTGPATCFLVPVPPTHLVAGPLKRSLFGGPPTSSETFHESVRI